MTDSEVNGNLTQNSLISSTSTEDLSEYTDADESISAPTEILAEFLSSIMMKDYNNALKYCKTILSYEPNNSTAKEFYPLIIEKLKMMQEEESDESSCDSSESLTSNSSSSSSNSCSPSDESKKVSDSEDTSGSFTSLEDDTDDDKNNSVTAQSFPLLPMDLTNGNVNNINENISLPTIANNFFKKSEKDTEKFEQIQQATEELILQSSNQSILIHPTETKTIKCSESSILPRTRTYVKNFSSVLQNEVLIDDASAVEKEQKEKIYLSNSVPKKAKGTKKAKSLH